jgi:hypothetical protein
LRIGHARHSEEDQTLPLQCHALQQTGCEQGYGERTGGKTTRCPERATVGLKAMRAHAHPAGWPRKRQPQQFQAARALREGVQIPVKAIAARLGVAPSIAHRNRGA